MLIFASDGPEDNKNYKCCPNKKEAQKVLYKVYLQHFMHFILQSKKSKKKKKSKQLYYRNGDNNTRTHD